MQTNIIDPSLDRRWDDFVFGHENASIYHTSEWKEVLERTYRHLTPFYIIIENSRGDIAAGAASFLVNSPITGNRLVGLPFSSYADPLFDLPENGRMLMQAFVAKARELKLNYAHLRLSRSSKSVNDWGFQCIEKFVTHILPLNPDKDELFASFHTTSVRQNVKRAEKAGLKLVEGRTCRDMKVFFQLHLLTRKKIGLPCQPERFFTNMFDILYPKGMLSLLMAEHSNQIVAAAVVLKYRKTMYSEYTAANPKRLALRPNHWIFWKAIESAIAGNCDFFDFGRSSISNQGLIDFKRRWGAQSKQLYYLYHPRILNLSSAAEGKLTSQMMPSIVRHLPLWLARISGRMLYNHLGG